jgi:hypothetical protein
MTGSLKLEDMHRHIRHEFHVPEGTRQISIVFDFEPKRPDGGPVSHEVSLSLYDPERGRGARHNNGDQSITITADGATPGYTAGPLQPGIWTICIDTHRIMPPGAIMYTLDIDLTSEMTGFSMPTYTPGKTASRGPGWYRGDLHGHTLHSDAAWDVPDFVDHARKLGLDFVTLTDHNTVSPLAQHDGLSSDNILTMGGIELTTFRGHALALGVREWIEWRVLDGTTMRDVAQNAIDHGALYIIAHPTSIGYPNCSGCPWHYVDMMPGIAPAVEVWNGPWAGGSYNEQAVQLYHRWLNDGHKLVATAGSDIHTPFREDERIGYNVVYADDLSETEILDGIRQGHLYISSGPTLDLSATTFDGQTGMMGDVLASDSARLTATWDQCETGYRLRLISNGKIYDAVEVDEVGERTWQVERRQPLTWFTVEIRDEHDALHAMSNPIFLKSE